MAWTEYIIAAVAVYGACLSTYTLCVQIIRNRPKVKVKISQGFLTSSMGRLSASMLFLSASNLGQKTVTLSSFGIRIPYNKQLIIPNPEGDVRFPHELLPGKSCQIWIEVSEIVETLKSEGFSGKINLIGFYRDQTDRTYRSKPFNFDISAWENPK
ncbi:MAG: hypothetical protein ACPLF9_08930 [Methanothermobacter tenebrarum]